MCATTGMPAVVTALMVGAKSTPPSSLTAWTCASLTSRIEDCTACCGEISYDPIGRSPTCMIHTEIISKTGRLLRTWRVTACTRLRSPNQEKTVKESSKNREKKKLTTKADLTALVTLRQCKTISSSVTALVSFIPSATIARLSPTRTISIPALSATYAEGKSWAVSIAMGSFFLYMLV